MFMKLMNVDIKISINRTFMELKFSKKWRYLVKEPS